MKFTCLQENLLKTLNIVSKAVPVKSSLPILSNVLIIAKDNKVTLSTTNLDTAIVASFGASVDVEGTITVPAKLLKDFISTTSPGNLVVELASNMLHVASSKSKTKFNSVDASDYPTLPDFSKSSILLKLDAHTFAQAVASVAFSAAVDESRPIYSGINLNYSDGKLTIAATNGFRLSEKTISLEGNGEPFSLVIPAKTLLELTRIFSNSTEPLGFYLNKDDNLAIFDSEDVLVATRIFEGNFPDYKRIIPNEHVLTAEFDSDSLLEAVRAANIFTSEDNNAVKLEFDNNGYIKLRSSAQETGEHSADIEAIVDGESMEIAFNPKYLMEVLSNVKTTKFVFQTQGVTSAGVLRPVSDDTYIHIIMPLRVQ